jgi:4-amino-4-deoxy-L-arabinose transferase-like glycosyltransferase
VLLVSIAAVAVLAFWRLDQFPLTWFDEGSHLHVPKALVRYGVYADYSSEGFRYFGPTTGVGPTVMLPVAGSFALFGVGLWQARLVIAVYLMGCTVAMFGLARSLGGSRLAWVATALLVASRGAPFIEYGRQVLGEVPALFFLICGLGVWFASLSRPTAVRIALAGTLFGLAMITKQQFLIVLAPTFGFAWVANQLYYRSTPQRAFILPAAIAIGLYAGWQAILILVLSPTPVAENLALLRGTAGGAAMAFSPPLIERSIRELLDAKIFLGALTPGLIYIAFLARSRTTGSLRWAILLTLVLVNLAWYVLGSVSWLRYAFPALAVSALIVGKLFQDWTLDFRLRMDAGRGQPGESQAGTSRALRWAALGWLGMMIVVPLAQTVRQIVEPPFNAPAAMAEYLNAQLPETATIETWEPEMGFLTDHAYHYPPEELLATAVAYIWRGSPSPSLSYDFVQRQSPEFVLVGGFARWVDLYPSAVLEDKYRRVTTIGGYELYELR